MLVSQVLGVVPQPLITWWLVLLLLVELLLKIGINPAHQLSIVESHDVYEDISERQRNSALLVASLVIAGLAIILREQSNQLAQQVELFAGAFGLLLIAAFAHELSQTYRVYLTFQELALEYGLLLLVYGLFLLVQEFVPAAADTTFVVFIIVFLFRFASVRGELKAHKLEFENSDYKTRPEFLQEKVGFRLTRTSVLEFLRSIPGTIGILLLMSTVYGIQLFIAGSVEFGAAFTAIERSPELLYFSFNPWLHSTHNHIFQNALLFVLFGAWTERKIGTERFVTGVVIIGYTTNIAPRLLGIGGFGLGASGITNALEAYFLLFQIVAMQKAFTDEPLQYQKVSKHFILFFIALIFVLKSIAEFFGFLTPEPGVAAGGHFIGVLLGFAWYTNRSLGLTDRVPIPGLSLFR